MGRKLTRPRPKQGEHLLNLRKAAGLSQYELAELLGEPQPNIAYWELSEKPPRSDLLPRMAEVLGVSIGKLLVESEQEVPQRTLPNNTLASRKLNELLLEASKLPKKQQSQILETLEALIRHYLENNT